MQRQQMNELLTSVAATVVWSEIDRDASLAEMGLLDSLAIANLVDAIEEEFSIELDPADLKIENFETIASIEALITARLGGA